MDLERLVREAAEDRLTEQEVAAFCSRTGTVRREFYDAFSRFVAHGFANGDLSYSICDAAMNALYGLALGDVPKYTWSVYLAFDAGEFYHSGDSPEVDPVEKYTRPAIAEVISADSRA